MQSRMAARSLRYWTSRRSASSSVSILICAPGSGDGFFANEGGAVQQTPEVASNGSARCSIPVLSQMTRSPGASGGGARTVAASTTRGWRSSNARPLSAGHPTTSRGRGAQEQRLAAVAVRPHQRVDSRRHALPRQPLVGLTRPGFGASLRCSEAMDDAKVGDFRLVLLRQGRRRRRRCWRTRCRRRRGRPRMR